MSAWCAKRCADVAAPLAMLLLAGAAATVPEAPAVVSDWPHLLGPHLDMTTRETGWPERPPAGGLPVEWTYPKGEGYAAPVVADGRVFLGHRLGDEAIVDCLELESGRRLWRFSRPTAYVDRYNYNGGPRCSPVVGDGRVFMLGADARLDVLSAADGRLLWTRDLAAEYRLRQNFFGMGATPLLEGGKLVVVVGAPEGGPCVIALDPASGREVWASGHGWSAGYAAPVAATVHGRRRLFVFTGGESRPPNGGLLVLDPADGRELDRFPWRGRPHESVNAAPPLVVADRVLISECYGRGTVMLRVGVDGRLTPVWTNRETGVHIMQPLARDGCAFLIVGHGPGDNALLCLDLETGATLWRDRLRWVEQVPLADGRRPVTVGVMRGWLAEAGGRMICLGELGHLLWLRLSRERVELLGHVSPFFARQTWSPPAFSRGRLLVVQNDRDLLTGGSPRLWCWRVAVR
ncbi:MAG: PQQ-like beta-propeller repeat protein [Kiritimatiellae bacterium]|nr:PQQ-like beta-propeller repeat protein [Kiritimatiellia bacterium]